jgi:hypothetical protein
MKERKVKWVSNPYKEIPKKVRDSADIKPGDGLIGLAGDDGCRNLNHSDVFVGGHQ